MVERNESFICSRCIRAYPTLNEAIACEAVPFSPKFQVGDVVTCRAGFGWFDGEASWVVEPKRDEDHGNCFGGCCTKSFYYVVTAIDGDPNQLHRVRYHVFTQAMSEQSGYRSGYTFDEGHWTPKLVEPRPSLHGIAELLGLKAEHLL